MEKDAPARKQLVRDAKREALRRMEDAARTPDDYKEVLKQWKTNDQNRWRRYRRWEVGRPNAEMLHWDKSRDSDEKGILRGWLDTVIPAPLDHAWWRQLLHGDFLDFIHDCPYEMHELTSSRLLSELLQTLNENQIEVLYYWVIRQESPQRIAARREQTDRNILKVYATLMEGLRKKLHEKLLPRDGENLPLTQAQKQFMESYTAGKLKTGNKKSRS